MAQHIGHIFLLHRLRPQLLQLVSATPQQLLAFVQVALDLVDLAARRGNLCGHLAEKLHYFGQVTIVLGDQLVKPDVGLLEFAFDFLLFLLALLQRFAGVERFDYSDQKSASLINL